MNGLFWYTLLLLYLGYFLGIIFSRLNFFGIFKILKNFKTIPLEIFSKLKIRSHFDFWFVLFAVISLIFFFFFFQYFLATDKVIQILIVIATLYIIIQSVLIKDNASNYRNRPIIDIKFDDKIPDYYHSTSMNITDMRTATVIASLDTYYVRLKIGNKGKNALENVEVVLEDVEPRPVKFMSLNLSWAGYLVPSDDIKRDVRLSQGQYRPLDVIEVIRPKETLKVAKWLKTNQNPDYQRYEAYSKGFRTCTIKPLSRSDIYISGKYIFYIGIYSDNAEPVRKKLSIEYDGKWVISTDIMRSNHLKVELLD